MWIWGKIKTLQIEKILILWNDYSSYLEFFLFFRFREQFLSKTIDDHLAILDQPTLTAHDLAGFAAAIADNNADWMHHIIEENGKLASLQDRFTPTGSAFIAVPIWFYEWYKKFFSWNQADYSCINKGHFRVSMGKEFEKSKKYR